MAYLISNKSPIDLEPRKAVGFGFPLNGSAVFNPLYTTKDQLKSNLINYILTNKGERVFNPSFGLDLRDLLYENITSEYLDNLKSRIQNDIDLYFPEIQIQELKLNSFPDKNAVNFMINYEIKILGIKDELNILLQ